MHNKKFLPSVFVLAIVLSVLTTQAAPAQSAAEATISGRVVDEAGHPILGVAVFLHNMTTGSITNKDGRFTIETLASGYGILVFSHVSFESLDQKVYIPEEGVELGDIRLTARVIPLDEIVIEAIGDGPRNRYVRQFIDDVVGTSLIARKARLENPDALRFTEGRQGTIQAVATQPLVIFNPLTGYRITVYLDDYVRSRGGYYIHRWISFASTPSDKQPTENRDKYRDLAYEGSLQHFLDAWRQGTLQEEGFQVRVGYGRRRLPELRWDDEGWYVAEIDDPLVVDYFNRPDPYFDDYVDRTYPTGPPYDYPRTLQRSRISFPEGRIRLSKHGLLLGKIEREGYWAFLSLGDAVPPLEYSVERIDREDGSELFFPSTEEQQSVVSKSSER